MNIKTDRTLNPELQRAILLAELRLTDEKDMLDCVTDMQRTANVDESTARIIAAAIRAKNLPNIARQAGLDPKELGIDDNREDEGDPGMATSDFGHDNNDDSDPHAGASIDGGDLGDDSLSGKPGDAISVPMKDAKDSPSSDSFGGGNDLGEANADSSNPLVQIKFEVPADKLDIVQSLLEKALGGKIKEDGAGDTQDFSQDAGSDPTADGPSGSVDPNLSQDNSNASDDSGALGIDPATSPAAHGDLTDGAEESPVARPQISASRKANTMTKNELAQRAAARQAIASEGEGKPRDIGLGTDTSHNGKAFEFGANGQYVGEDSFPAMTLENSGGNSLREQNPTFAKQVIPTTNFDNLQLKDSYEKGTKTGTPDGSLQYSVDFGKLDNVPAGPDAPDKTGDATFKVPTQMPELLKRNTTVACQGCHNTRHASVDSFACNDCRTVIAICDDCVNEGYCPSCAARTASAEPKDAENVNLTVEGEDDSKPTSSASSSKMFGDGQEVGDGPRLNIQPNGDGFDRTPKKKDPNGGENFQGDPGRNDGDGKKAEASREMDLFRAKVKFAYSAFTKLALAKGCDVDEIDALASSWIDEPAMTVKAMRTQALLMLRNASSATERVQAASAERTASTRTASVAGFATTPAFSAHPLANHAVSDIQSALKGIFTMPTLPDYDK